MDRTFSTPEGGTVTVRDDRGRVEFHLRDRSGDTTATVWLPPDQAQPLIDHLTSIQKGPARAA
ncbi:hypothetical protein OHV05_04430 [Kitasatospora sp. NBC_00070]|uniref:hypothetical protein n=1 Tax=Kitasatospora sp. NBC_00070 TaxID=2975962 RepID=UPI00324FB5D7